MEKISLHIFHSPIENESRLFKEAKSLIQLQIVDKVIILGIGKDNLPKRQYLTNNIVILRSKRLSTENKVNLLRKLIAMFNLLLYFLLIIKFSVFNKFNFISVHNLLLLPMGCFCKFIKKNVKLIYEPHELETERTGLNGLLKRVSIFIEQKFIRYSDKVLTVCQPITEWYQNKYSINNVLTIRNVPNNIYITQKFQKSNKFREEFSIPENSIIYIYQGVLDLHRGVNDLVDIFGLPENNTKHLILMGYGDSVEYIQSKNFPNVHYKSAVPVNEIITYTSSADIGIFFVNKQLSESYKLCLPNKFFEYAIAGLPILVSDNLIYLSEIIKDKHLGWSVPTNFENLKSKINSITKSSLIDFENNIDKYRISEGWELEQNILYQLYNFS